MSIWCVFSEFQIYKRIVFHLRVFWKLYRSNNTEPASDDAFQAFVGILSPAYQLRKSRVLYLGRPFVHGPSEILGIITASLNSYHADNYSYSWLATLHNDLISFSSRCPAFVPFPRFLYMSFLTPGSAVCSLVSIHVQILSTLFMRASLLSGKFFPKLHLNEFRFPVPLPSSEAGFDSPSPPCPTPTPSPILFSLPFVFQSRHFFPCPAWPHFYRTQGTTSHSALCWFMHDMPLRLHFSQTAFA